MKLNKRISKKFRRGSILAFVLVIGLCLALLGVGMLQMGFGSRLNSHISVTAINAREAADAGIAKALYLMNAAFPSVDWEPTGSDILPNSNASYFYEITVPPYATPKGVYFDHYQIKSIGTSDRGQRIVYAVTGVRNLLEYGLIVTDKIILKSNTVVDGYNSGPFGADEYGAPNAGLYLRIGTTSVADDSIWLGSDTVVSGDVLAGIDGDVYEVITNPSGGADTGPWYNLPEPWQFDPISVPPDMPSSSGSINNGSTWVDYGGFQSIVFGAPGVLTKLHYDNINVPNSNRLVFKGPVELYVPGNINLNNSSEIFVGDPLDLTIPSSLRIYLGGDLQAGTSNGINNLSEWPRNFRLFGTGLPYQKWVINNSGDFYGVYYGPNADIEIKAQGEVYGSVSGHRFELKSGAGGGANVGLHYDHDLADLTEYDTGFGIDRWWEEKLE